MGDGTPTRGLGLRGWELVWEWGLLGGKGLGWWSDSTPPVPVPLIGIGWTAWRCCLRPLIEKVWSQCRHNNLVSDAKWQASIFWDWILLVCMLIVLVRGAERWLVDERNVLESELIIDLSFGVSWSLTCHLEWRKCFAHFKKIISLQVGLQLSTEYMNGFFIKNSLTDDRSPSIIHKLLTEVMWAQGLRPCENDLAKFYLQVLPHPTVTSSTQYSLLTNHHHLGSYLNNKLLTSQATMARKKIPTTKTALKPATKAKLPAQVMMAPSSPRPRTILYLHSQIPGILR